LNILLDGNKTGTKYLFAIFFDKLIGPTNIICSLE